MYQKYYEWHEGYVIQKWKKVSVNPRKPPENMTPGNGNIFASDDTMYSQIIRVSDSVADLQTFFDI